MVEPGEGEGERMAKRDAYDFEERRFWWPLLNLNKRFLSSDFLANYSRGYIWAANQLGHFTLGLIGALGYFWFADTLYRAFSGAGVFRGGLDGAAERLGRMDAVEIATSGFAALVLIGVFIGLIILGLRIARKPLRLHEIKRERDAHIAAARDAGSAIPPEAFNLLDVSPAALWREKAERAGLVLGLIAFVAIAAVIIGLSFSQNIRGAFEWRAYAGSVLVTTLLFAAFAALLSQSAHYTLMSWTVLVAAALMWEPRAVDAAGLPIASPVAPPEALSALSDAPLLAVLAVLFLLLLGFTRLRDSYGRAPWRLILIISAFFVVGALTPDPELRRAIAAGFASLGVWWVKEFGADLPTVENELQDAHDARVANGHSAWNGVAHTDDFENVRRECFDDTLCDARSDGLFYFAGAAMAVGLLISPSVIDVQASRVVPAFGSALLFLALYWTVGWYWIRRAVALDRVLVLAAQRFAMLESAFVTRLTVGGREVNPVDEADTPRGAMQRLRAFAHGDLAVDDGRTRRPVQHLVICGAFGVGRSALGHAIACEAALVNAPPWSAAKERRTGKPLRWARFLTMRGVFERYVFNTRGRSEDEAELEARRGAPDLFVIDQADPYALETVEAFRAWAVHHPEAREDDTAEELRRCALAPLEGIGCGPGSARERLIRAMLRLLKVDVTKQKDGAPSPDQTAWIVFAETPPPAPGQPWDPAIPPRALAFAEDLRQALAARSGGAVAAEDIPVAFAIVGRPENAAESETPRRHGGSVDREMIAETGAA